MAIKYSVVQQKYDITGKGILNFFAKTQASDQTDFVCVSEASVYLLLLASTFFIGDHLGQLMEWQYTQP